MKRRLGILFLAIRTKLKKQNHKRAFKIKAREFPPLIVFQMGKVASSSVYYSAKKTYKGDTLHLHNFDNKEGNWKQESFYVHGVRDRKPIKIISLTREPVGRNISAFFQNFELITGIPYSITTFSIGDLKNIFLKNPKMNHDEPLTWFDDNLLKYFKIDVYERPFPNVGWQIQKKENVELLLMKSEINNELKESLIKEFLNTKEFKLSTHNVGEEKDYTADYKKFKTQVKLPNSYLDKLLNSRYCQHFYDKKELESSRRRWQEIAC